MVKNQGLTYSEMQKLWNLWGRVNQFQKENIISQYPQKVAKSPKETKVKQNDPKKEKSTTKTEDLHIKN